jgi:hypothetical protein
MFNHSKYHPQLVHKVFLLYENNENDTPLNSLMESTLNPKGENNERIGSCSTLFGSQHFGGRGLCWSFGMGTKKSDKQVNYSHELAKPNKLVSA